ncbi:MAG: leucine-rich repeat domain-containing protein, partial [Sphingobacteriia bacterium]
LLDSVGTGIARLRRLNVLILAQNPLRKLADNLHEIPYLYSLDLSDCGIDRLPPRFGQIRWMHTLYLDGNKLSTLPKSLYQLEALEKLDLRGNPLPQAEVDAFRAARPEVYVLFEQSASEPYTD